MLLSLKYRPRTFQDIVGQPQVQVILRKQVELDRVPPLLLFRGTWGSGKTTTGRVLAAALNCPESKSACGQCPSCLSVHEGKSLAVWEIDAASHGGIDDIRALKPRLMAAHSGKRVVLFDEAQSLTTTAQNALLALFEDPPPDTHFVIITTEPHKLLDTILSRAEPYDFYKISSKIVTDRLQAIATAEGIDIDPDLLAHLVTKGQGSLRNSIMLMDQAASVGITSYDQYSELMQVSDFAPSLIAHMSVGDVGTVNELVDHELDMHGDYRLVVAELISTLRDVLTLKNGATIKAVGKRLFLRQSLASRVDETLVVTALHLLWDVKTQLRADEPKSSIQLVTVLMTEVLSTGVKREKKVADPDKRMSIEDLRNFKE